MFTSRSIQPYHFQADLNWCDGTFNDLFLLHFGCQSLIHTVEELYGLILVCGLIYILYFLSHWPSREKTMPDTITRQKRGIF